MRQVGPAGMRRAGRGACLGQSSGGGSEAAAATLPRHRISRHRRVQRPDACAPVAEPHLSASAAPCPRSRTHIPPLAAASRPPRPATAPRRPAGSRGHGGSAQQGRCRRRRGRLGGRRRRRSPSGLLARASPPPPLPRGVTTRAASVPLCSSCARTPCLTPTCPRAPLPPQGSSLGRSVRSALARLTPTNCNMVRWGSLMNRFV